jgi:hypothetical protein
MGLTLLVLAIGRTFDVNNVMLDVIFGTFGGFGCIAGGYMFGKLENLKWKKKKQN